MNDYPKIGIRTVDDLVFVPLNEEALKQHLAQTANKVSLKELTPRQRKKYASKPIYLVRYE